MPNKLKYYLSNKKKTYTLKETAPSGDKTKDAHYKFIRIRSQIPSKKNANAQDS